MAWEEYVDIVLFFLLSTFFLFIFTNITTQYPFKNNKHVLPIPKVQTKGREREIKKQQQVIPLYSHVY